MNGTIIVAIITVVGSIVAAAITSYLTKAKDREHGHATCGICLRQTNIRRVHVRLPLRLFRGNAMPRERRNASIPASVFIGASANEAKWYRARLPLMRFRMTRLISPGSPRSSQANNTTFLGQPISSG